MKSCFHLVAAVLLAGCAAQGPAFDPASAVARPGTQAKLVLYRPSTGMIGMLDVAEVDVNKKSVCGLSPDGAFVYDVAAGDVAIAVHHWGDILKAIEADGQHFHVDGGKTYYLKIEPLFGVTGMPEGYGLQVADQTSAEIQLSKMKMEACS